MTRQIQKNEELHLVEQMRRALGGIPVGQMEPLDEPDVCIVTSDRRIGIEVTELHQDSGQGRAPRRLQESERSGIVGRARVLAEASGMPVVDVAVHFNESIPISKSDRGQIVNELVQFVSAHLPGIESSATVDLWRESGNTLPWIRTVRLFRASFLTRHHWSVPDSGWVHMNFVPELQAAIDEKHFPYARYVQHCDECWLLIVASGGRPAGLFEASAETRSHVYCSLFARTFFMEAFSGALLELSTKAA
jgi:hypothetical protein